MSPDSNEPMMMMPMIESSHNFVKFEVWKFTALQKIIYVAANVSPILNTSNT